jgi:hypothetical protein
MLVDIDADGSETQEEEPGTTLDAQVMPEVATLELLLDQDNISTSVVSELGLELNHLNQDQEAMPEEKPDSDMLDRVQFMLDGVLTIQSRPIHGDHALETVHSLHASILRMIDMVHGGSVTSKVLITSD